MLVIEVQLPQQEGRKKIEWNKNGDPTFEELKGRIQQCGVPDDWCVEVLRGNSFVSPDLQTHIHGPKITVRASPVLDLRVEEEHPDDIQWTRWMKTAFEKVISHVGRLYLVDTTKEEEVKDARGEGRCVGTVSLMDCHGECICALHCIYPAVENPERYKIYAAFPNYLRGCLSFEAKPRIMDEEVDVCVIEPVQPLKKPYLPTSYLDLATDVREDDIIYCFFFPRDPLKHVTPQVLQNLLMVEKKNPLRAAAARRPQDNPTIIAGTVCFSEWMQGVAAYERPPDCNGGILVSRSGRVKGIHVKAFTCGELRAKVNSENPEELRVARKLCRKMSTYAPTDGIPVFVPPHGLVRLLGLEGGCELLQAAIRQNKEKMKMNLPKQPKPPRSSRSIRSSRSTRSRCSTPHKCRTSNKRRRSIGKKVGRR
ncbi:hypothetical protein KC19_5G142900 [Ceratodon purpureus]|uniref:Uncharacterized protein n=1 Tax=Ceratodon purpureus TaxID=3225 RepID=A0A8T0I1E4_CERPU|nr:hypothetical protein KC19_5G142900 [Ceratodon purpureus]